MSEISNPYEFKITKNYKCHTTINSSVPINETYLVNIRDEGWKGDITIPAGVRIIKVSAGGNAQMGDEPIEVEVYNKSNNKYWINSRGEGVIGSTVYVQVTPGKNL